MNPMIFIHGSIDSILLWALKNARIQYKCDSTIAWELCKKTLFNDYSYPDLHKCLLKEISNLISTPAKCFGISFVSIILMEHRKEDIKLTIQAWKHMLFNYVFSFAEVSSS